MPIAQKGKIESRRFARVRPVGLVAKTAKLILDSKTPVIECQVIDLSSGGACLALPKPVQMPRRFEFLHGGVKKSCFLIWQKHLRVGIGF
jgi:hypothetical protein